MFVNIAPTVRNVAETACSLHFAQRVTFPYFVIGVCVLRVSLARAQVKKVDLGPARRSGDRDAEVEKLRAQVKQLQGAAGAAAAAAK
jgi:hypothetical protein